MSKKNHIRLIIYYHIGATLPFCLAVLIGLFLSASHEQDPKYVSEYFTDDGFGQAILFYILFSLIVCLLSCPIFLNSYKVVANHFVFSLLTWILLPFLFLAYSFNKFVEPSNSLLSKYEGSNALDYFFVFIVLSHSVALIISFYHFRSVLSRTAALYK